MVCEGSGTSGQVREGSFGEKAEERRKKETPKGGTPSGLREEGGEVFGKVAQKVPPRVVVVVAVGFVVVAALALAAVVAAAVAVAEAAGVVFA